MFQHFLGRQADYVLEIINVHVGHCLSPQVYHKIRANSRPINNINTTGSKMITENARLHFQ